MANILISQVPHGYPNIPVSQSQYPNIPVKNDQYPNIPEIGLTPPTSVGSVQDGIYHSSMVYVIRSGSHMKCFQGKVSVVLAVPV